MPARRKKAPEFELLDQSGETVRLSDFAGKKLVVFFYPKDDTPACTTENQDFTSLASEFAHANTHLIGISPDSVEKHQKFITKHKLGVTLLADPDISAAKAFKVWGKKKLYGKEYDGLIRTSFLIDEDGKIIETVKVTRVKGHAQAMLDLAKCH